ncbi:hypothetical protein [Lysobacter fragariae]
MLGNTPIPTISLRDVSEAHARGLRRDLFRWLDAQLTPHLRVLPARLRASQWPYSAFRDRKVAYLKLRETLIRCNAHINEQRTEASGRTTCAVLLMPQGVMRTDGVEPVLAAYTFLLNVHAGKISVDARVCGVFSHHAIERMYQRLRTNSHAQVVEELRGALWWVTMLYCSATLSPRGATLQQLPIPTANGVLRCIRQPGQEAAMEVRTFTARKPGSPVERSVETLRHWATQAREGKEQAFAALLREPANRWWREAYRPGGQVQPQRRLGVGAS